MSQPIRVAIADDHVLVLDGLRQALDALPDIQVVAVATTGDELAAVIAQSSPDVVLVDIEMPGRTGLAVLRELDDPPDGRSIRPSAIPRARIAATGRTRCSSSPSTNTVAATTTSHLRWRRLRMKEVSIRKVLGSNI